MKVQLTATAVLAIAGVAAAGFVAWRAGRVAGDAANAVGDAVGRAGQAINPLNRDNVFYSGVNSAGAAVTGDENWNLGGWLYDITHGDPFKEPAKPSPSGAGPAYDVPGVTPWFGA